MVLFRASNKMPLAALLLLANHILLNALIIFIVAAMHNAPPYRMFLGL
jgi:hypothetical protein